MLCNRPCSYRGNDYTFSSELASFEEAQTACSRRSGRLATRLDLQTYRQLSICCQAQHGFWVGLQRQPENICPNKMTSYQWLDDATCIRSSPLRIVPQPINKGCESQGVAVNVSPFNGGVVPANTRDCGARERYICQIPQRTTTRRTTTTKTHRIVTTAREETSPISVNEVRNIFDVQASATTVNVAAIAGGVAGFLVLFLLLLFLYCWRYKKLHWESWMNLKKGGLFATRSESSVSTTNPTQAPIKEDHLYYTVEAKESDSRATSASLSYLGDAPVGGTNTYSVVEEPPMAVPAPHTTIQYQEMSTPGVETASSTENLVGYETIPELNARREYDTVFEPSENEITEASIQYTINIEPLPQHKENKNEVEGSAAEETVEYTTVRPLSAPLDIYAVPNKKKK